MCMPIQATMINTKGRFYLAGEGNFILVVVVVVGG